MQGSRGFGVYVIVRYCIAFTYVRSLRSRQRAECEQVYQQQVLSVLVQRRDRPQHKGLRPDTLFTTTSPLASYPLADKGGDTLLPAPSSRHQFFVGAYLTLSSRRRQRAGSKGGGHRVSLLTALLEAATSSKSTKGRGCSFTNREKRSMKYLCYLPI